VVLNVGYAVRAGKAHTIGESLTLPAAEEISFCMFGQKEANVRNIPLSNDRVSRRIKDIACNTKDQLIRAIQCSPWFAIQVAEDGLKLYLSKITPIIDEVCKREQAQPSH
jgi:hypothetical protein